MGEQETTTTVLGNLLETCRESEAGLRRAVIRSKKKGLKEFFGAEALRQALFAAELELELKKLGVITKHLARPRAKLRGWKEIRGTRLLPAGDETVLLLCERGQRDALGEYLTALRSGLPTSVLELVERQHSQLREACDHLDQIREQLQSDEREARLETGGWAESAMRVDDNTKQRSH